MTELDQMSLLPTPVAPLWSGGTMDRMIRVTAAYDPDWKSIRWRAESGSPSDWEGWKELTFGVGPTSWAMAGEHYLDHAHRAMEIFRRGAEPF